VNACLSQTGDGCGPTIPLALPPGDRASPLPPGADPGVKSTDLPAEARTKSVITAATKAPGSSVTAGCSRMSAAPVPPAVRNRSAHSARPSASSGNGGP
jgi:hypothetical protein